MNFIPLFWCTFLLVPLKGVCTQSSHGKFQSPTKNSRTVREIRRGHREGRLYLHSSEEPRTPRNMLLPQNRPLGPLHGLYRKGFSHRHVPDFRRQPLEEARTLPRLNQSLDDIISGIIHLLGGDVHVTSPHTKPTTLTKPSTKPSRINNRGPAHFDEHSLNSGPTEDVEKPSTPGIQSTTKLANVTSVSITPSQPTPSRWLFPGDKDVSYILGLLNDTAVHKASTTDSKTYAPPISATPSTAGSATTSTHVGLVEVSPSSNDKIETITVNTTPSFATSLKGTVFPTRVSSVFHSVATENKTSSDFLIEIQPSVTIFISEPTRNATTGEIPVRVSNSTSAPSFVKSSHSTVLPASIPSTPLVASTSDAAALFPTPTAPVTDWLPISVFPSKVSSSSANRTKDEEPVIITEPTEFEMTVTQQMGAGVNRTIERPPVQTRTRSTYNVPPAPTEAIISTQVDIVYGRPTMALDPPPKPTGKPHVFAVDISQVRPSNRPGPYQRPRFPVAPPPLGNGLRPVGPPRTSVTHPKRPQVFRPSSVELPEVRIDTCVVGDDSTCDVQLYEHCRTERGVSSCLCRPGFGRAVQRGVCSPVVSMLLTLKVAKIGDQSVDPTFLIPGTQDYKRLLLEANQAMSTVFAYSPLAEAFRGSTVNQLTFLANRMVVNSTVHLAESEVRGSLRHHIEHAVSASINRRSNQVGDSRLYVSGPLSALVEVEDLNECSASDMNDCSPFALCENLFGTFQCTCNPGYTDKAAGNIRSAGRLCSACSPDYCGGRGKCVVVNGRQECRCRGNYSGSRCQIDNEVVGVSVGVSLIAVIVIAITAACLYLWNRRWKQAQQKSDASKHVGYRLQTLADHIRWGATTSPLGSAYMSADGTMRLPPPPSLPAPPPPITSSASQLYTMPTLPMPNRQERRYVYEDDINPYGRIIRTLQKSNNQLNGMQYDTLSSECASSEELGFPSVPSNSFIYHGSFPERSSYR